MVIAGPNGVGKSALLYQIYRTMPLGAFSYYPGHRVITFNNGWSNLNQDISQLRMHLHTQHESFNRFKGSWSEDHIKSIVRRITNAEAAFNAKLLDRASIDPTNIASERYSSPISKLNSVFASAGLSVSFSLDDEGIIVRRGSDTYRIDSMSDGERAALFLVSAILVQEPGTVIMFDEPERHLHPSIAGPLVEAATRLTPDIGYIFATHDMSFISSLEDATLIHVTDSKVTSLRPEIREFVAEIVRPELDLPDGLRADVLGARSKVLFVEGNIGSHDRDLYARLYQGWKVVPKGGWEQCDIAVRALRGNSAIHWIEASALIDGDQRDTAEKSPLLIKIFMHCRARRLRICY